MELILSHLNTKHGPQIIHSFPRFISENVKSHLFRILQVDEDNETYFNDLTDGIPALHSLFLVHSKWNSIGAEKILLSIILEKRFNRDLFVPIMEKITLLIKSDPESYKGLFKGDPEYNYDPMTEKKYVHLRDVMATTFDELRFTSENISRGTIAVMGLFDAGKTSLIIKLQRNIFVEKPEPKESDETKIEDLHYNNTRVNLIDMTGDATSWKEWLQKNNRIPDTIIFVVDISASNDDLLNAKKEFDQVIENVGHQDPHPNVLILGNKIDTMKKAKVNTLQKLFKADKLKTEVHYGLVSAKTGEGLKDNFDWVIQKITQK